MTTNHNYFLNLAFQLAEKNLGQTGLNPSVGSVVVKNNTVISSGITSISGRPHAEFNALSSAFHGTTGHSHDGGSGNSPKINLATSVSGYLPAINGGIGGKNNLSATSNPIATDDSVAGYAPGSIWINTSANRLFVFNILTQKGGY